MNNTLPFEEASKSLSPRIHKLLSALDEKTKAHTQEIRLRSESKICLRINNELTTLEHLPAVSYSDIREAFESICGYSVYAHQNSIAHGYVTVQGGHRAGICGTAVINGGQVTMLRDINAINLRIARDAPACSIPLFERIDYKESCGILVAGAPMSGKTTLLRSVAAYLSNGLSGRRYAVSVLDERGELASVHGGVPGYESVRSCDVLSGCPKSDAISFALRSMAPEIIICDEIGTEAEASAVSECINAGVSVIASVHAGRIEDILSRPVSEQLIGTGAFRYIAMLSDRPLKIERILKTEELLNEADNMRADNSAVCGGGVLSALRHKAQVRIA